MSAGFEVEGKVFWGSNGAIEAYVEVLAAQATDSLGSDSPLAVFFRSEKEAFFTGKIVFLDEWLGDGTTRSQFLQLLDTATDQLLRENVFTGYGREWVSTVIAEMREEIRKMDGNHEKN